MNRVFVAFAGAAVSAVAASSDTGLSIIARLSGVSLGCLSAIEKQLSNDLIRSACGRNFDDIHLIAILVVAGGVFVVIGPGKDMLQRLFDWVGGREKRI